MINEYKEILWTIVPLSTPIAIRNCKKCKRRRDFYSSDLFRVNANHNSIDIWLVYKCSHCNSTWNATIITRKNVKEIERALYEKFLNNDKETAWKYAFDVEIMNKNKTKFLYDSIDYSIIGEDFDIAAASSNPVSVLIKSQYRFNLRLDRLLREKLEISRNSLYDLVEAGHIKFKPNINIRKHKLKEDMQMYVQELSNEDQECGKSEIII